jgi:hypothetical protein
MSRSHFYRVLTNAAGDLVPGCQVRVLQPGGENPIDATLFIGDTGSTSLANPFVSPDGRVDFYLDDPLRFRLAVTDQSETAPREVFFENADAYEVPGAEVGVIPIVSAVRLRSQNGTVYEVTADNDGTLITTVVVTGP